MWKAAVVASTIAFACLAASPARAAQGAFRLCIASLLREGAEQQALMTFLDARLSGAEKELLKLETGPGAIQRCSDPNLDVEVVGVIAHVGRDGAGTAAHLTVPVDGADLKIPWEWVSRWVERSKSKKIYFSGCKPKQAARSLLRLTADPRVAWLAPDDGSDDVIAADVTEMLLKLAGAAK